MSMNQHGLPSRVPVIAQLGRLFADPQMPDTDKRAALELLLQDHADLDEVEAQAALWAMGQLAEPALAQEAWLACAQAWWQHADLRCDLLDAFAQHFGTTPPHGNALRVLEQMAAATGAAQGADLRARIHAFLNTPP